MRTITQFFTIVAICACAICCGQTTKKNTSKTLDQLHHTFVDVMLDSTASWNQIVDAVYPFADSLCVAATDENSLRNRMYGQEWGYMTIELLCESFTDLADAGKEVNNDDLETVVSKITKATTKWFYSPDEQLPHIWRDHYYVSNKSAEHPTDGFFHLMVTLPTQERPKPTLQIFYPDCAVGRPAIIFRENLDDQVVDDDFDMKNLIELDNWYEKDEVEEDMPMQASADETVVEKMLTHPVMYLLFQSDTAADGTPGELEVARVNLAPLQSVWKEHVK